MIQIAKLTSSPIVNCLPKPQSYSYAQTANLGDQLIVGGDCLPDDKVASLHLWGQVDTKPDLRYSKSYNDKGRYVLSFHTNHIETRGNRGLYLGLTPVTNPESDDWRSATTFGKAKGYFLRVGEDVWAFDECAMIYTHDKDKALEVYEAALRKYAETRSHVETLLYLREQHGTMVEHRDTAGRRSRFSNLKERPKDKRFSFMWQN